MTAGRATCIVFSDDDLPSEGSDHKRPLFIYVGLFRLSSPSVLLDNGSGPERMSSATAIALGYAPSDFGPSTQTVRAYDSTQREVMGTLEIELLIGPATFCHRIPGLRDREFLPGFCGHVFDQHSSTVVLDIMRSMSYLPGMGWVDVSMDRATPRPPVTLRDGAPGPSTSALIAPSSPDRASLMTLCFPDEIDDHGTFLSQGLASSFDLFGVSTIELVDESLTAPAPELVEDVIAFDDWIDGPVGLVEGVSDFVDSPLSFDVMSGFVSRSDIIFDIDGEIAQHDSDDDSSSASDSDPIDKRVSPAIGDTEIVDFGTADQPRELRIR
ncbi:hypothetical protein CK203_054387 [Vitis vinifera]|uniref:Uncharacterized protein n=1 Tax=Vitis vinifera TaxID=29760 RepID=A0A438GG75_VITVI|nr:hypothetical protein CK203_054387 [Vitis vinifera]